ncbi:MAG: hypothetical protein ACOX5J_10085 [Candidatus Hydrogenedentales bacterium]
MQNEGNRRTLIPRKVLRNLARALVVVLAICFVADHGEWLSSAILYRAMLFSRPPASAYYDIGFSNASEKDVIVTVQLLNDLRFEIPSPREVYRQTKLGRARLKEVHVPPGTSQYVMLTSKAFARMGCLLVVARTEMESAGLGSTKQDVAVYLLSWYEASYQMLEGEGEPGVPVLAIEDSDFVTLDWSVDRPSARIRVLRKIPKGVTESSNWNKSNQESDTEERGTSG